MEEWKHRDNCWEKLIMKSAQVGKVKLFCTILWLLWHNRNKCFHNKHCDLPGILIEKAKRMDESCSLRIQSPINSSPPTHVFRSLTQLSILKVNIDAAYDQVSKLANLRVVIRNHLDQFLLVF